MAEYQYSSVESRLRSECERGCDVAPRSTTATSPTGERFVELINPDMRLLPSEEDIYLSALATFRKYAEGKGGTIYWRTYPEVEQQSQGWKFYMRVLVSDKPALHSSKN